MNKIAAALGFLFGLSIALSAFAQSTINPGLPAFGLPYNAQPIQQNFQAAANDINALSNLHAGASPPANPVLGMLWLNTPPSSRVYPLNVWDGQAWLTAFSLDAINDILIPPIGGGVLPNVLSAVTTDLGSVPQASLTVTGNNTINSFGASAPAGTIKVVLFSGSPTLTASNLLILPGTPTIVQQPGDVAIALATGNGVWQILFDQRLLQDCSALGNFSCTSINKQPGPYTAQPSDCSNVIQFNNSGAFTTLTVGPASTYPANCELTVVNADLTRGKEISLSTTYGPPQFILWPGQSVTLYSFIYLAQQEWLFPQRDRWRLNGATVFYVDPSNGQDPPLSDCLAPTSGACQTIQGVMDHIQSGVDLRGQNLTVSLAPNTTPGAYKPFQVTGPWIGLTSDNQVTLTGQTNAAANYLLDGQGAQSCISVVKFGFLLIENLTVQNCVFLVGGNGQGTSSSPAQLSLSNVALGFCAGANIGSQIFVSDDTFLKIIGAYNIISSNNCLYHYRLKRGGRLLVDENVTGPVVATITTNLAYTAFASVVQNSSITFNQFTGSPFVLGGNTVTGLEFETASASTIEVGYTGQFFPGNAPGGGVGAKTSDASVYNAVEHDNQPTIGSCGGGSPTFGTQPATDYSGLITEGTAVTSCSFTFASPFIAQPRCTISPWGMPTIPTNLSVVATRTTMTISHDSFSGAQLSYNCHGG